MLSKSRRSELKQAVHSRLEEIERLIESLQEGTQPVGPDNAIGRLSRMEAIHDQEMLQANLRAAKARRERLHQVLSEIDSDEFGICARCEEPIAFERLLLVPESRICVACAG